MVRVPSIEEEDHRRRGRERERLIKERVQHLGRIKGLLMTQGVRDFQPAAAGKSASGWCGPATVSLCRAA